LVEGDGWGVGFADFEEQGGWRCECGNSSKAAFKSAVAVPGAAVGWVYGEVEDFRFIGGLAGQDENR